MRKIPSVFVRDFVNDPRFVLNEVTPGCEWVLVGEGRPTLKRDGTAVMVRDGNLYKRYDAKNGKAPPFGFEPCQDPDPKTGHWPGWLLVGTGPEDQWFRFAWEEASGAILSDGTYELCGPKFQTNPEKTERHVFFRHGVEVLDDYRLVLAPLTFSGIKDFLREREIEGIVFHHPDGCMAKIKRSDFGLVWAPKVPRSAKVG